METFVLADGTVIEIRWHGDTVVTVMTEKLPSSRDAQELFRMLCEFHREVGESGI